MAFSIINHSGKTEGETAIGNSPVGCSGTVWLIPKNATKPLDGRRKSAGQSGGEHHD